MAFTNLLAAMYPVGSIYLSTTAISPSSTIGGTWTQVKGATLAATGANSFADGASYGGNLKISIDQIPPHNHTLTWIAGTGNSGYIPLGSDSGKTIIARSGVGLARGGARLFALPLELLRLVSNRLTLFWEVV